MTKYCTYLTIYSGNKLPPFYIGYSTIDKVLNKNYHGTPTSKKYSQIFYQEQKENPHLFKTKLLTIHKTRKEATLRETKFLVQLKVQRNFLYINMSNSTNSRYNKGGHKHTTIQLEKMSKRMTGKNNPMYGKTGTNHPLFGKPSKTKGIPIHTEQEKLKMKERVSGQKNYFYGKHWITTGIPGENKIVDSSLPLPNGWKKGLTKTKTHISNLPQNNKGHKRSLRANLKHKETLRKKKLNV